MELSAQLIAYETISIVFSIYPSSSNVFYSKIGQAGSQVDSTNNMESQYKLVCNTGGVYLRTGIYDTPGKENGTRINVANQEDEGTIYSDCHGRVYGC